MPSVFRPGPMIKRRILLADARPVRRGRLAAQLRARPELELLAETQTLAETYTLTEALAPDAVLIGSEMAARPEFGMVAALARSMGIAQLRFGEAAVPGVIVIADDLDGAALIAAALNEGAGGPEPAMPAAARDDIVIALGASTGGVEALERILPALPPDAPPTLIVQHIRGEFTAGMARRLDAACACTVQEARDGVPLRRGHVYLAPGNAAHLLLAKGGRSCRLVPGPEISGHRPSVDALFRSLLPCAPAVVAALLTGMGRDGAEGLLALRRHGAHTIAQDRASSVVHGMPRVAVELGAACEVLPIGRIGAAILAACQAGRPMIPGRGSAA